MNTCFIDKAALLRVELFFIAGTMGEGMKADVSSDGTRLYNRGFCRFLNPSIIKNSFFWKLSTSL